MDVHPPSIISRKSGIYSRSSSQRRLCATGRPNPDKRRRADSRIARRRPESDIFGPVPRALCMPTFPISTLQGMP